MNVELYFLRGCPHVAPARELLTRCLAGLGLDVVVDEFEGDSPSPSILVDGVDVMGEPASPARSCRLDVPTTPRLMAALRRASQGGQPDGDDGGG